MAPRTIDNLGVETSTRYAQDQKDLDAKFIKESQGIIPRQAEVEAVTPSFPSEVSLMFGLEKRNVTWAAFFSPPKYNEQKKRLFSHNIIPALGSQEKKEAQMARINSMLPFKRESNEDKGEEKSQHELEWEAQREKEDEEKEKKILLTLLNSISHLDKFLSDVNSRRTQYQRG